MNSLVKIQSRDARPVKELVVISGKGGTGKTSLVASIAALAKNSVLADCDVDAADLHLLTAPRVVRSESFTGGKHAHIDAELCVACGACKDLCRFGAILSERSAGDVLRVTYRVDPKACEGCSVCAWFCPSQAIQLEPAVNGEWFISETRFGPMVHAQLGAAEENSGKLVTLVRTTARRIAEERGIELVIVDGSPGIGCPVIASITGADMVLVVTEPTPSGLHDMERVAELIQHFRIPAAICINKWDLNARMSSVIEEKARERKMALAGRVRYDRAVTKAQLEGKTAVEYCQEGSASDIRQVWKRVSHLLSGSTSDSGTQLHPEEISLEAGF
jgi:MinD superfamily P-loop ATPase